jgi:hypothetical protein
LEIIEKNFRVKKYKMLTRCTALTTSKPIRLCSRNTVENGRYCTQHSKIYERIEELEKLEKSEKLEKIEKTEKIDESRILIDIVEKYHQEIMQYFTADLDIPIYY